MAVSKVIYGGDTLIDLTEDSVTPETLAEGVTAHDASGQKITGTMASGGSGTLNTGTCTVVIVPAGNTNHYVYREVVNSNDTIGYKLSRSYTSSNISLSARCDSNFVVMSSNVKSATATGGEILAVISGQGFVFKTPATDGESVQITIGA